MRYLYYNPFIATGPQSHHLPGMSRLALYHTKLGVSSAGVFFDRSGAVRTPIRIAARYPIPSMRALSDTYEDVCNARAAELLARMERLDVRMYLFWSGGIDSTLMLVSFLKHASPAQRERLTVLLTEQSILEYPDFYHDHIRGKLAMEVATMFPYLLGTKALLVTAELNDIVFTSEYVRPFMGRFDLAKVLAPFDRDAVRTFFTERLGDTPDAGTEAEFFLTLFERIRDKAPIPLATHLEFFWWVSFCTKWQSIATRLLAYTADRNAHLITPEYVRDYFTHFYDTENFQLWAMNNLDKRIKDDWKTSRYPCKDIIYDYTKDAVYRDNKTKKGSLSALVIQQNPFHFIDENFGLHRDLPPEAYHEPENDFI